MLTCCLRSAGCRVHAASAQTLVSSEVQHTCLHQVATTKLYRTLQCWALASDITHAIIYWLLWTHLYKAHVRSFSIEAM